MSDEQREQDLIAENAALREQKQQLESQLEKERLRKRRAWTRQCFICAFVLMPIASCVAEIRVPFGGKIEGTDTAAMVIRSLGAILFVAGVISVFKSQTK